jgi:hypothetical protein
LVTVEHHIWRVRPALPVLKIAAAVALPLLTLAFRSTDRTAWAVAGVAAAALGGWALRDLVTPVRLAADPDGLVVAVGFAGRRRIPWSRVEGVRVDRRQRRGLRNELLEIDTGDTVHVLSAHDLGTPPQEVADLLAEQVAGARRRGDQ